MCHPKTGKSLKTGKNSLCKTLVSIYWCSCSALWKFYRSHGSVGKCNRSKSIYGQCENIIVINIFLPSHFLEIIYYLIMINQVDWYCGYDIEWKNSSQNIKIAFSTIVYSNKGKYQSIVDSSWEMGKIWMFFMFTGIEVFLQINLFM